MEERIKKLESEVEALKRVINKDSSIQNFIVALIIINFLLNVIQSTR